MARRQIRTVTVESVWTWVYRGIWLLSIVGGAIWFTFQMYSDVGTLKTDVHSLFEGQKITHQQLEKIINQQK